jgi:hypothetical protein
MTKNIFVTNRGIPASGKFEGRIYDFPTGVEMEISEKAAKHIFGYGDDNKEPYFVRLGWMKMNTDLPRAKERLADFTFSSESRMTVHLSAPVVERVAAPMPEVKTKGKGAAKVQSD